MKEIMDKNENVFKEIDEKTQLAGSNKLELLLFSLGTDELFGINVFKIKEVAPCPKITKVPNVPEGVMGVFSLRGNVLPALDLAKFLKIDVPQNPNPIIIVTEYAQSCQGFVVNQIDKIIRVDWEQVKSPRNLLNHKDGLITAVTELENQTLVSILDVEQILFDAFGDKRNDDLMSVAQLSTNDERIGFFADDSGVARRKVAEVFEHLKIKYQYAENGKEAWERLDELAQVATKNKKNLKDVLKIIVTDAEMPEMDGYVLTKKIKADMRFDGIPVIMHSSLSSNANQKLGKVVGVDEYIAKFDPKKLAIIIKQKLEG